MKRLNPHTNAPYKKGDHDAYTDSVFLQYRNTIDPNTGYFRESWTDPATFAKIQQTNKQWQQANKDKRKQINATYYQSNKE